MQDINFWGSIYPTQFAIPHLMRTNGKIVINASCAGVLHAPKGGFYNVRNEFSRPDYLSYLCLSYLTICKTLWYENIQASKAALISFYESSLRYEVSPRISITILTLGFIGTNMITPKYSTTGVGVRLRKVSKSHTL